MATFDQIPAKIAIGAGQVVRRNAGNSAFEAYTPTSYSPPSQTGNADKFLRTNGTVESWQALIAADIPNLDAAKITSGTFADARIPSLAASKITSGTFATARLGSGTASSSSWLRGDSTWTNPLTVNNAVTSGTNDRIFYQSSGNLAQSANLTFNGTKLSLGGLSATSFVEIYGTDNTLGLNVPNALGKKWLEFYGGNRTDLRAHFEYGNGSTIYSGAYAVNTILKNVAAGVGIADADFTPAAKLEVRGGATAALRLDNNNGATVDFAKFTTDNGLYSYGAISRSGYALDFASPDFNLRFAPRSGGGGVYFGENPVVYAPDHLLNVEPVTTSQGGLRIKTLGEHFRANYDNSNYLTLTVSSAGVSSFATTGSYFSFNKRFRNSALTTYADDTAAGAGGLSAGDFYKTSAGVVMVKL